MGRQDVKVAQSPEEHRDFMQMLLRDLRALERMLEEGRIESGKRRIGVEQELVLVDRHMQPAPIAVELLERLDDPRIVPELARFNLEFNLDPEDLGSGALANIERSLREVLADVERASSSFGARPILCGILPTLELSDLTMDNIYPAARYRRLDEAIRKQRGGEYRLRIGGPDDLQITHDSVMIEAVNTSFQVHYQTGPEEFAQLYNLAQALAGPLVAIASNSPVLFAKRLWRETRIAIFQQAVDTRANAPTERDTFSRVRFGEGWVEKSVAEIFRNDIARLRLLFGASDAEDPAERLDAGLAPALDALQLHNSTAYRWNRACYGSSNGLAHLRIENRVLPAGPTVLDEVANASFWIGLMAGGVDAWGDVSRRMQFADARTNFAIAAREGLGTNLTWFDGAVLSAPELVRDTLLPVARAGLEQQRIDASDIDRYLGVIAQRVDRGQTGAQWLLDSAAGMRDQGTRAERLVCLTRAIAERQSSGVPVHEWPLASLSDRGHWKGHYQRVEQYMSTNLFTVREDDVLELAAAIMDWEKVRHVPVEDDEHRLVGVISHRKLLRLLAQQVLKDSSSPISVRDVMERDVVTCSPRTPTLEAIRLMRERKVGAVLVTKEDRTLVGIVSERDFMPIAGRLLEEALESPDE